MYPFQSDKEGNLLMRPVTGWAIVPADRNYVVASIEYLEVHEELTKGESRKLQVFLLPQQCLELAETLASAANYILEPPPPGTSVH